MLEKEIKNKIIKTMELSLEKSNEDKNTIFVNFSGHSECLEVYIFKKGWQPKNKPSFRKMIFFGNHTTEENIKMLDEIIEKLNKLKI